MITDTIAAISTPPGKGGIAVIRISGNESLKTAREIFVSNDIDNLLDMPTHTLLYGKIIDNSKRVIDTAILSYMKAPKTYTGEDIVEISCHGSYLAANKILELILKSGARLAGAGEFTKRAFLNGKLDLSKAEAVIDIINSPTSLALDVAVNQLEGGLSSAINKLRDELIRAMSSVQVLADFPDEGIEEMPSPLLLSTLKKIKNELEHLLTSSKRGLLLREGALLVIAGKPNVGKSSLLNTLSKSQRAIVTDIPGTTRDIIEQHVEIDGIPLCIVDTAGLRDGKDFVEKLGIEKTKEYIEKADILLFVCDLESLPDKDDIETAKLLDKDKTLLILNKIDKEKDGFAENYLKTFDNTKFIKISALTDDGIDLLRDTLKSMLIDTDINDNALLTRTRHIDAVKKAAASIEAAITTVESGYPEDLIFIDIENAISALGEISGLTVDEEIIDRIFSEFCVGK